MGLLLTLLKGPTTLALISLAVLLIVLPCLAFLARLAVGLLAWRLEHRNDARRRILLSSLDIREHEKCRMLVGFFHPYCNAGGGGERVLWTAIAYMQRTEPDVVCVVYTGDVDATPDEIVAKVKARFSVELQLATLSFVYLKKRRLVEDTTWPRFTLLGQSIGSMFLAYEGLSRLVPDVFIDTMGYAFALDVVKALTRCPIGAYVHYPTISSTMVQRVQSRAAGHTNESLVAASSLLTYAKVLYYILFTELYSVSLRQADHVMVNSTWTFGHVQRLLQPLSQRDDDVVTNKDLVSTPHRAHIVYPPCDCTELSKLPIEMRETVILSIAQFRPEKEHTQQLHALRTFLDLPAEERVENVKLILAGSVRNKGDEDRIEQLKALAKELGLEKHTEFVLNASYADLMKLYGRASIGLSTMVDEHFGINVVEMMAAGLIPVVHASGGPLLDIVANDENGHPTGFHAKEPAEYAAAFSSVFRIPSSAQLALRQRARQRAIKQFDTATFEKGWGEAWQSLQKSRAMHSRR